MARCAPGRPRWSHDGEPNPERATAEHVLPRRQLRQAAQTAGYQRDTDSRWFGGVCSGLAQRFGVDPVLDPGRRGRARVRRRHRPDRVRGPVAAASRPSRRHPRRARGAPGRRRADRPARPRGVPRARWPVLDRQRQRLVRAAVADPDRRHRLVRAGPPRHGHAAVRLRRTAGRPPRQPHPPPPTSRPPPPPSGEAMSTPTQTPPYAGVQPAPYRGPQPGTYGGPPLPGQPDSPAADPLRWCAHPAGAPAPGRTPAAPAAAASPAELVRRPGLARHRPRGHRPRCSPRRPAGLPGQLGHPGLPHRPHRCLAWSCSPSASRAGPRASAASSSWCSP